MFREFQEGIERGFHHAEAMTKSLREMVTRGVETTCLNRFVVLASGSVGRQQATSCSDFDLIVIHDGTLDASQLATLKAAICEGVLALGREPDLFSISSADEWSQRFMPENYFLLCSEMFFARYVAGSPILLDRVWRTVSARDVDRKNAATYITYSSLYRARQLKKFRSRHLMLKYAPGGQRDLQFIHWVGRRMCHVADSDPRIFVRAMVDDGFLRSHDVAPLVEAAGLYVSLRDAACGSAQPELTEALIGRVVRVHGGESLTHADVMRRYDELRSRVRVAWREATRRSFEVLEEYMGKEWCAAMRTALRRDVGIDDARRIIADQVDDSVRVAVGWQTKHSTVLNELFALRPSWAVLAAVAQNQACDIELLDVIAKRPGDENRDLRIFAAQNPATSIDTLRRLQGQADRYSSERRIVDAIVSSRGAE